MIRGLLFLLLVSLAGCSDTDPGLDRQPPGPDLLGQPEQAQPSCGAGIYPCGPYGVRTGDVAADLEFLGYRDPEEHCKQHGEKTLDMNRSVLLSFKDFHLGDAARSCRRKLLWVMVSAGWCAPCKVEVPLVQEKYASGGIDARVAVLNLVFETETRGEKVTDAFLRNWASVFKLTLPAAMDPSFKMGAYFDAAKVPFNMLVDLTTMKIYYQQTGGDINTMTDKITAFFNQ